MRHVILHYHLFKNAGTSLDQILQTNFGQRWTTQEFPTNRANTSLVSQWIADHPETVCFSSHTMLGPLPELPDVRVVPILLLRDPIARIASAYHFERKQMADTLGARLAKQHDITGYVRSRLAIPGDRQCRNFQTARLASLVPGADTEARRAREAIALIQHFGVLGLVAEFEAALAALRRKVAGAYPQFEATPVRANASGSSFPRPLEPELSALLNKTNAEDIALLDFAKTRLHAVQTT